MIKEKEINKLTNLIVKKYQPEKIILFGSFAYGKPHKYSDIDLLVVKKTSEKPINRGVEFMVDLTADSKLPNFFRNRSIELLVYTPDEVSKYGYEDFFLRNILKRGKILYSL